MRRFSFSCDARGVWTLTGTVGKKPTQFCNLPAALEVARKDAGGEEADLELWAEGLYIFVHQENGWPHCLCVRAPEGGGNDREIRGPLPAGRMRQVRSAVRGSARAREAERRKGGGRALGGNVSAHRRAKLPRHLDY
jgi:hypothetical protein